MKQLSALLQKVKTDTFRDVKSTWDGASRSIDDLVREVFVEHLHRVWSSESSLSSAELEAYTQVVRELSP